MTTPITPIRLTDEDKAKFEDIRRWHGLPSLAAAIRMAGEAFHRDGPPSMPSTPERKRIKP